MTPTVLALFVVVAGLRSGGHLALQEAMLLCLFGAAAAIELPALGGATLTPAVMFLPFLVVQAVRERGVDGCLRTLSYPAPGFWLLAAAAFGICSAGFLPRLFAGDVLISTVDRTALFGLDTRLVALGPVSTNITQSAYALGSVGVFAAVAALLAAPGRLVKFRDAVLLLAALNCAAALINLAELYLNAPKMLALVRNGSLKIFDGGEVGGLQRISGTFSETAAFAAFTLPLFAFAATLWRRGVEPLKTGALAALSLLLLLFSTSGTAYVSLAIYLGAAGTVAVARAATGRQAPRLGTLTALGGVLVALACIVILTEPALVSRVADFFDATVLRKSQSSSGKDRGSANAQAWSNFIDTYGLGVGLGSARASSFALVLLSNLGVAGTLIYLLFLRGVLAGPLPVQPEQDAAIVAASRQSVWAALVCATVSGAVFDLGVAFYAFAAAATAPLPLQRTKPHAYA